MSDRYEDILEKDFARQIKFNNIEVYHKQGYKGKGWTVLNTEDPIDHGAMTNKVLSNYAPEATILNSWISAKTSNGKLTEVPNVIINGEKMLLEDAIIRYKIKVITTSFAGSTAQVILDHFKYLQNRYGVIFVCAAGNDGYAGARGKYIKNDTAIAVGAVRIKEDGTIERLSYSAVDDEVDFVSFMARGVGTSAASPGLAANILLLLNKYGDFNQAECVEILKSISLDLGESGDDKHFGWGLPILPLTDTLKIVIGGTEMVFTDLKEKTKDNEWYYESVKKCVDAGLLQGYEDNTFRPEYRPTRAEWAVVLAKLLDKLNL